MSYKIVSKSERKRHGKPRKVTGEILHLLTEAYLFLMLCIFPLYYQNKYYDMGEAKYTFYRNVTLGFLILESAVLIVHLCLSLRRAELSLALRSLSLPDRFVAAYAVLVLISYLLSDFQDVGLWGYPGWNVGLITQLCFVAVYFLVSRFYRRDFAVLNLGCLVAAAVFLLGVLNRFTVDPLKMYENLDSYWYPLFLSTIGQATWYSSYLCTVFPLGLYLFWKKEKPWQRLAGGIFAAVGFASMVTQNSDSAFIGFSLILLAFFWFSFDKNESFLRFWQIILIGLASFKLIGLLQILFPERVVELEPLSTFASQHPVTLALLLLAIAFYIPLYRNLKSGRWDVTAGTALRKAVAILFAGLAAASVVCVVLVTKGVLPESLKSVGYLNFNDAWGNGRGFTWKYSVDMFRHFPLLNKLFGCGPDGYASYTLIYRAQDVQAMWGGDVLTNAHNEWLTSFLFFGIAGGTAYIGIFIGAVLRFAKKAAEKPFLVAVIASALGYMGHNLFCYQQVVCTSLIFILLGVGEALAREDGPAEL